ncbi:unnamed protein product [Euphydryas editha]|uniref:FP protein C-terminal domain-containing protein n=1 Tax=Euphydryas editha TaxID=104508 RepID=A0AAU9VBY8_EUPED|nr:unnamed protein product [Euphydryas editha]
MPLNRSPLQSKKMVSPSHHKSDPSIPTQIDSVSPEKNIASRSKRKRVNELDNDITDLKTELMAMLKSLQDEQVRNFTSINSKMEELINQNQELKASVEFISAKYDEFTKTIEQLEKDKKEDRNIIKSLEEKVEYLEKKMRSSCLEIKNIPLRPKETKEDLVNVVVKLGNIIKSPIQSSEIKEIYRVPSVKQHPIVVEFITTMVKERVLRMTKQFNGEHQKEKLNTKHLQMSGIPIQQIYVSESLTSRSRRLFFLARDYAARKKIKFCWTSGGKVFLRRDEKLPLISINSEQDLKDLHGAED